MPFNIKKVLKVKYIISMKFKIMLLRIYLLDKTLYFQWPKITSAEVSVGYKALNRG